MPGWIPGSRRTSRIGWQAGGHEDTRLNLIWLVLPLGKDLVPTDQPFAPR
ncbi:hypothetical protein [Kribbella turkmenica]|nr:hypothetical protein [Kribbella turkmenica]